MIEISAASCAVDRGLCLLVLIFQPRGRQLGSRPLNFGFQARVFRKWKQRLITGIPILAAMATIQKVPKRRDGFWIKPFVVYSA